MVANGSRIDDESGLFKLLKRSREIWSHKH
jgi:hypothetical protein